MYYHKDPFHTFQLGEPFVIPNARPSCQEADHDKK